MKHFLNLIYLLMICFSLCTMEQQISVNKLEFRYPEKLSHGSSSPNKLRVFLNNEEVGYADFFLSKKNDKEILDLDNIQFPPWYRKQGYGRATLGELKRFAAAHGIDEIWCRAGKGAVGFHEACGAIKVGKQEDLDILTYKIAK